MLIKNCKLRALSNNCCLDFIGQNIDEICPFPSLRYCLRPSKWRVRRPAGRNFQPYDKLRYSSEPPFDVKSKLCTHLIVTRLTRELQPDFTSNLSLPKLEKLKASNLRLSKDSMSDEQPLANALAPRCFPSITRCRYFREMTK